MNDAHGVIHIHSCPLALAAHVEWTIAHVLGQPPELKWSAQPFDENSVRASITWSGRAGFAAQFASALRGWEQTRFEVWESTGVDRDGVRYAHTPELGIFFSLTDAAGNAMVGEDRIRYAVAVANGDIDELEHELSLALGTAWDDELEPYRAELATTVVPLRRTRTAV